MGVRRTRTKSWNTHVEAWIAGIPGRGFDSRRLHHLLLAEHLPDHGLHRLPPDLVAARGEVHEVRHHLLRDLAVLSDEPRADVDAADVLAAGGRGREPVRFGD